MLPRVKRLRSWDWYGLTLVITDIDAICGRLRALVSRSSSPSAASPAAYINLAANEAEKAADVNLMHVASVGVFGRLWMAGTESNILAARDAAVSALEGIDGRA